MEEKPGDVREQPAVTAVDENESLDLSVVNLWEARPFRSR